MQHSIAREHNLSSRAAPIQNLIRCSLWVGVLFLAVVAAAGAETDAAPVPCPAGVNLASDDVVARLMSRNAERARELLGFQATRHYQLHYTGFPSTLGAEMQVKVSYMAPGTKRSRLNRNPASRSSLTAAFNGRLD